MSSDPDKGLLLETLFLTPCLLTGKTRFEESQALVWVKPEEDETLLFFSIDDKSNPACKLRKLFWGKQEGQSLCDLIVFYAKEGERIFCFVELKDNSKDIGHATEQVTNTYEHFKQYLSPKYRYTAKTFISTSGGSVPKNQKSCQSVLAKKFGKNNFAISKHPNELGDFLRGVKKKKKNK
jgi:hypothetical protein